MLSCIGTIMVDLRAAVTFGGGRRRRAPLEASPRLMLFGIPRGRSGRFWLVEGPRRGVFHLCDRISGHLTTDRLLDGSLADRVIGDPMVDDRVIRDVRRVVDDRHVPRWRRDVAMDVG